MQNPTLLRALLLALIVTPLVSLGANAQNPSHQEQTAPGTVMPRPLFSEDFESGALDPALWTQQVTGDAILKVQSAKVAHGRYALQVSSPNPANRTMAFIMAHNIPVALSHHLFGRASMYVTGLPDRHIIFLTAGTPGFPKYRYQEVASAHSVFQLTFVNTTQDGPLGEDYHAGSPVPLNRWFLLEWEFNDQPDQATIWVDGVEVFSTPFARPKPRPPIAAAPPDASAPAPAQVRPPVPANSEPAPQASDLVGGFTDLTFGFRLWGAAPVPFDIYYDDIALDTHRIGPVDSSSRLAHSTGR
jgi:hypothetical protein